MKVVRKFKGHSGSSVYLVEKDNKHYVYKNVDNAEQHVEVLKGLPFSTPEIIEIGNDFILMEYLPGLEMKQYLTYAGPNEIKQLTNFLIDYITFSFDTSSQYDFSRELWSKYSQIREHADIITHVAKIPTILPKGTVHGDFTLENIIFYNNKFYFIDAHCTNLNSIYFDANKLRQDINGLWFAREETNPINYSVSCNLIYSTLSKKFNNLFNDNIYAFMLARILPYCKRELERHLVLAEIKKCKL